MAGSQTTSPYAQFAVAFRLIHFGRVARDECAQLKRITCSRCFFVYFADVGELITSAVVGWSRLNNQ